MSEEHDDDSMELLMPFALCASNGGPHDDDAFVSGFRLGQLYMAMAINITAGYVPFRCTVRVEEVQQVDLMAMRHNMMATEAMSSDGEWVVLNIDHA